MAKTGPIFGITLHRVVFADHRSGTGGLLLRITSMWPGRPYGREWSFTLWSWPVPMPVSRFDNPKEKT